MALLGPIKAYLAEQERGRRRNGGDTNISTEVHLTGTDYTIHQISAADKLALEEAEAFEVRVEGQIAAFNADPCSCTSLPPHEDEVKKLKILQAGGLEKLRARVQASEQGELLVRLKGAGGA